jgi:GAF domain-containing protein
MDRTARIERLRTVAGQLQTCEAPREVASVAVAGARDLFDADACSLCTLTEGEFRPKAALASELHPAATFLRGDAGIAGRTVEGGESIHLDDISAAEDARPTTDSYRSIMSIPVVDDSVFQIISDSTGAFDATEREFAELLVTHVEHALGRVRYERQLRSERDRFATLF